jgi:hypothetical protein
MRPAGPPPAEVLERIVYAPVLTLAVADLGLASAEPPVLPPRPPALLELEDEDRVACGLCSSGFRIDEGRGSGDVVNPANADPAVALTDWHAPVICPRCGGTGYDPNPGRA